MHPAQATAFAAAVPSCTAIPVTGGHEETTLRRVATDHAGTIAEFVAAHT
ncbi:hypothetical protein [Cellulosimicrobium cellulans]|nr:hypothetical protein [Cellulosimicrobium cellulans]